MRADMELRIVKTDEQHRRYLEAADGALPGVQRVAGLTTSAAISRTTARVVVTHGVLAEGRTPGQYATRAPIPGQREALHGVEL
jgi:hypothetical protein